MVNKVVVVVGILVLVVLGFVLVSNMTGNVITRVDDEVVSRESFRISGFGNGINEEEGLNGTQNSTEPKVPYK